MNSKVDFDKVYLDKTNFELEVYYILKIEISLGCLVLNIVWI